MSDESIPAEAPVDTTPVSEEPPMAKNKPEPAAAEVLHVPDDQQMAEYRFTMTDAHRKGIKVVKFPPHYQPVTFMRPDQTSAVVRTSAAVAQQMVAEGWAVEKV